MAAVPVARQSNGFEPPPSSILVTHVVQGDGVPDFDHDSFNQLLTEVLGVDEQGRPKLGSDASVNHKLIRIVFQVGIQQELEENPFQNAIIAGRADSQLRACLEVLQVAIERSPQVLFAMSNSKAREDAGQSCALYSWLFLRLLPLVASRQNSEIRDRIFGIFTAMLDADTSCATTYSCSNILQFMRACVSSKKFSSRRSRPTLTINSAACSCHLSFDFAAPKSHSNRC